MLSSRYFECSGIAVRRRFANLPSCLIMPINRRELLSEGGISLVLGTRAFGQSTAATPPRAQPAAEARAARDKVDGYIEEQMRTQHIPGLSLAVVQGGKVVKTKGYGLANIELNVQATPSTVYQLQSITKSFV